MSIVVHLMHPVFDLLYCLFSYNQQEGREEKTAQKNFLIYFSKQLLLDLLLCSLQTLQLFFPSFCARIIKNDGVYFSYILYKEVHNSDKKSKKIAALKLAIFY